MGQTSHKRSPWPAIVAVLLLLLAYTGGRNSLSGNNTMPAGSGGLALRQAPNGSLGLFVEPTAGITPVVSLINNAKHSADLVMYELTDSQVEQSLVAAESRGVNVRVLLNGGYYGKPDKTNPNQAALAYLQAHGVPVRWTPAYFALTHQKTLAVDGKTGVIMTFNLTPQYYASSRDFGVIDTDKNDVSAIETVFNDDWQHEKITAPSGDDLVWSPGSEAATLSLITSAKTSLKIYNEEMADRQVVNALGAAALRGVDVQIIMTDQSSWHKNFAKLKNDGVHIRIFSAKAPLYVHAKMIVADDRRAFVGSENFSPTSLTRNRELGIVTAGKAVITRLDTTFSSDWQAGTPY
jgi:phosphatidylserine/phosphatidylglycerophosphate/cardiolipin synthase-like enzyme